MSALNPQRALRTLYMNYGYAPFRVRKFEDYDLYAENKRFLQSHRVLTFTDTDGRLKALKPDITLSIVKSTMSADTRKVFYHENVYREPRPGDGFCEIPQMGLECIGALTGYDVGEVVMLAARSLAALSEDWVLAVSHIGVIAGVLEAASLDEEQSRAVFAAVSRKNAPALSELLDADAAALLQALLKLYGPLGETVAAAQALPLPEKSRAALAELESLSGQLALYGLDRVMLDLSVVNDVDYYDDIVFRGFVPGAASAVLAGGRYDRLLQRMGKPGGALGFAVYLDRLETAREQSAFDGDVLVLFETGSDLPAVVRAAEAVVQAGETVRVAMAEPEGLRFRRTLRVRNGEVSAC
ncbi:MAG: ATP phosphoribosyltransferase regulatory subunit [Oscillospiraceae bacterium]|nr:ATP phosphoribosyltransferase regulatory subunit [Oscillospiraceae bacterium]MBQ9046223.1 ATP phosphoribosyltransferase regulatory subunit [Oscillospiraceae bacterium]